MPCCVFLFLSPVCKLPHICSLLASPGVRRFPSPLPSVWRSGPLFYIRFIRLNVYGSLNLWNCLPVSGSDTVGPHLLNRTIVTMVKSHYCLKHWDHSIKQKAVWYQAQRFTVDTEDMKRCTAPFIRIASDFSVFIYEVKSPYIHPPSQSPNSAINSSCLI